MGASHGSAAVTNYMSFVVIVILAFGARVKRGRVASSLKLACMPLGFAKPINKMSSSVSVFSEPASRTILMLWQVFLGQEWVVGAWSNNNISVFKQSMSTVVVTLASGILPRSDLKKIKTGRFVET